VFTIPWKTVHVVVESVFTIPWKHRSPSRGIRISEERTISHGSLFVPIAQPKARLVMSLLEPRAPDSFVSWGYFNAHFEQKEYMEDLRDRRSGAGHARTRPELAAGV